MKKNNIIFFTFILFTFINIHASDKSTNDAMIKRQHETLEDLYVNPYPKENGMWMYESFATSAYYLGKYTEKADKYIQSIYTDYYSKTKSSFMANSFHWHAYILERIYWLFSSQGVLYPNRMDKKTEDIILSMLWDWTSKHCTKEIANPNEAAWIWGSENHHLQAWVSFWGATQILKGHPQYKNNKYSDGNTPEKLWKEFNEYFKAYFRNRAQHGLMVEIAAPTYAKYSLNTIYNIADFAEDKILKELASNFLNVYWAEWAIEQINGVRGGSRHRCYPGRASIEQSGAEEFAWYHFGIGRVENGKHPGNISILTTFWRPDKIVSDLVCKNDKGNYSYISRNYGLKANENKTYYLEDKNPVYKFNITEGGLLRYTWITPSFVMGMTMENALTENDWNAVSSQNRWNGIIFSDNYTQRIFTQPEKPEKGSVYNAEWGVQNKGVMILQRLKDSNAKGQAIWIDRSFPLSYHKNWIFTESSNSYVALKIIDSKYHKIKAENYGNGLANKGFWLKLENEYSPIIIEAVEKKNFKDFSEFKKYIIRNVVKIKNQSVEYRSNHYDTSLKLYYNYSRLPEIDGKTIDLTPKKLMDSPYLNSIWGSGIITISNGIDKKDFNFNY